MKQRKVRADFDKRQPIAVNVCGCAEDTKKKVIQAFFDVGLFWSIGDRDLNPVDGDVNSYTNLLRKAFGGTEVKGYVMWSRDVKGITPEQFFSMVYEDDPQGHPHAELMMAYAEDAKTHAEPWKLWQIKAGSSDWISCKFSPAWDPVCQFRRKPQTHLVHGVEVPDLRIKPSRGESYYYPYSEGVSLVSRTTFVLESRGDAHRLQHNLCYEDTEAGKQAAILHAKAMLGIAQQEKS